jgi:hypothetical protein
MARKSKDNLQCDFCGDPGRSRLMFANPYINLGYAELAAGHFGGCDICATLLRMGEIELLIDRACACQPLFTVMQPFEQAHFRNHLRLVYHQISRKGEPMESPEEYGKKRYH